jgi:hypothetical protein
MLALLDWYPKCSQPCRLTQRGSLMVVLTRAIFVAVWQQVMAEEDCGITAFIIHLPFISSMIGRSLIYFASG